MRVGKEEALERKEMQRGQAGGDVDISVPAEMTRGGCKASD